MQSDDVDGFYKGKLIDELIKLVKPLVGFTGYCEEDTLTDSLRKTGANTLLSKLTSQDYKKRGEIWSVIEKVKFTDALKAPLLDFMNGLFNDKMEALKKEEKLEEVKEKIAWIKSCILPEFEGYSFSIENQKSRYEILALEKYFDVLSSTQSDKPYSLYEVVNDYDLLSKISLLIT